VITDTMAFMFETRAVLRPTSQALAAPERQDDYWRCWQGLRKNFHSASE
jgi:homogentisate 1,2-dioxygenase